VATVELDGARNAGILAIQILAAGDPNLMIKMMDFKEDLKKKIIKANEELSSVSYEFRV